MGAADLGNAVMIIFPLSSSVSGRFMVGVGFLRRKGDWREGNDDDDDDGIELFSYEYGSYLNHNR